MLPVLPRQTGFDASLPVARWRVEPEPSLGDSADLDVLSAWARRLLEPLASGPGFAVAPIGALAAATEDGLLEVAAAIGSPRRQAGGRLVTTIVGWPEPQPFHTDAGEVLLLRLVSGAASGGAYRLVSARTLHDRLAEAAPEALACLHQPWSFSRKGRPGPPTFRHAIFSCHAGRTLCFYLPNTLRDAVRAGGAPHRPDEVKALAALDEALGDPELAVVVDLTPGEVLAIRNQWVLHARDAHTDRPDDPRAVQRVWLDGALLLDLTHGASRGELEHFNDVSA